MAEGIGAEHNRKPSPVLPVKAFWPKPFRRRAPGAFTENVIRAGAALCLSMAGVLSAAGATTDFSGQLSLRGGYADTSWDASADLRLMGEIRAGRHHRLDLHYEVAGIRNERLLGEEAFIAEITGNVLPDDSRRVLDLTKGFHRGRHSAARHRLDRLAYQYEDGWGSLTVGRAAITWGNGLVFNPMDLFNPFAPTDVERDYKIGDDLALLTLYPAQWNGNAEWQLLLVPRRSTPGGSLRKEAASLALKGNFLAGSAEWDVVAALHYNEPLIGIGHTGYLGGAVWRWDAILTFPENGDEFFSTVLNLDYSWVWAGLNCYGSIELHYNGLGLSQYGDLLTETPLLQRLQRGEVFTLGRFYVAPSLQVELHPLLNLHLTGILNTADPSGAFLPRLVWSFRQDMELTLGASLYAGGQGTEFGGFPIGPGQTPLEPADRAYAWLKWFF